MDMRVCLACVPAPVAARNELCSRASSSSPSSAAKAASPRTARSASRRRIRLLLPALLRAVCITCPSRAFSSPPPRTAPTYRTTSPVAPPPHPPLSPLPASPPQSKPDASPHTAAAAAATPPTSLVAKTPVSVPTPPLKAKPATLPPRPISHVASFSSPADGTPRTSPTFQPLQNKHSYAHSKHSAVSSSLLALEKTQTHNFPSSASPPRHLPNLTAPPNPTMALTRVLSPKRQYLNIRKHPFRFPAAKEVVQNLTEQGDAEKRQLLFYESSMLPQDLQ